MILVILIPMILILMILILMLKQSPLTLLSDFSVCNKKEGARLKLLNS